MKNRLIRWVFLLCIGLGIGAGIGYFQAQSELEDGVVALSPEDKGAVTIIKNPSSTPNIDVVATTDVGGAFALINQDGEKVTEKNFADTYKLVFFGFTFCPAVCPTELQKIAVVMDELGEDADKITPILISVDPERDTPEVMKDYVSQFHPKIVGLTGSQDQIDAVKNAFKVFAKKVENEMMEGYMIDHSAFTYLTDKNNKMIAMYPSTDTAQDIAKDIKGKGL